MTPADRPALANFPNRVSAGSAIFRFHGSVTVLTDKTLDLLLDLVDGQREAITAVDDRGIACVARFARDDLILAIAEVAILVADERNIAASRASSCDPSQRARSAGIERFRAEIQADNTVARRFFLGLTPTARERHSQRRRGGAHQRSGTTSHTGVTFARPPGPPCGAPVLAGVAGTRGENATAAGRTTLHGKSTGRPRSANALRARSGFTTRVGCTTDWLRSWNRSGESLSPATPERIRTHGRPCWDRRRR